MSVSFRLLYQNTGASQVKTNIVIARCSMPSGKAARASRNAQLQQLIISFWLKSKESLSTH